MAALTREPIDARQLIRRVESPSAGAILTFAGVVRDRHDGRRVEAIEYHAYDSMAEKELTRIEEEIPGKWPGVRAAIIHRAGLLQVGEASVLISVSSPHRAEGFEALRYAIDSVKKSVPIWKKEIYPDGHAWIEGS